MASAHKSVNASKGRAILNEAQAVQIFQAKVDAFMQPRPSSKKIGALFGISEKAVRDIWNGRTWRSETCHMDPTRPVQVMKQVGRPKGSKDSKPRAVAKLDPTRLVQDMKQVGRPKGSNDSKPRAVAKLHGSQQRAFVSDSIDDQLHEWVEGTSTPSELIDPFRFG